MRLSPADLTLEMRCPPTASQANTTAAESAELGDTINILIVSLLKVRRNSGSYVLHSHLRNSNGLAKPF